MRKLILVLTILISSFCLETRAEESTHSQLVEELIISFDIEASTDFDIVKIVDIIVKSEPQFTAYRDVLIKFFSKYLTWDSVKPLYVGIISKEFSSADLLKINSFLKTPAFKEWLKVSGDVEKLSEADKLQVMEFISSDVGIHFFKTTQDLTIASNEFVGKVVLDHKAELDAMMKVKTEELAK